ncbi:MAG: SIMPL domain-containing protein [Candidatus Margulisiibacteriota bacterium]
MKKILVFGLFCALAASTASGALLRADKVLVVTGTGQVQTTPDTAIVRLGVEVSRKLAQEAQSDNAAVMQKIAAAIAKLGIPAEKVQTSGYNIWAETKYEQNQPPRTVGYRCANQVNVVIEDLAKISRVIDFGINAGANNVQGISFFRKDDAAAKRLALEGAVKDAAAKALAIAQAANLKLRGIKSIIESGAAVLPPSNQVVRAMSVAGENTPVSPGLVEVRGNVSVTYDVD